MRLHPPPPPPPSAPYRTLSPCPALSQPTARSTDGSESPRAPAALPKGTLCPRLIHGLTPTGGWPPAMARPISAQAPSPHDSRRHRIAVCSACGGPGGTCAWCAACAPRF